MPSVRVLSFWLPWVIAVSLLAGAAPRVNALRASAYDRYPLPGDNLWRSNDVQALQVARNWYSDGILASGFLMRFKISSVEEPSRGFPYLSYPPGFALAVWSVAVAKGRAPELADVMQLGAAWQWASSFLLLVLVAVVAGWMGLAGWDGVGLGTVAALTSLFMPASVIFFPFAWWADIMVLPFYLAALLCETASPELERARWFRLVRVFVLLVGGFCDWLFLLLLFALLLREFTAQRRGRRLELMVAALLPLFFHALLLLESGIISVFWAKIVQRTGLSNPEVPLAVGIGQWLRFLEDGLGGSAAVLLYVAAAVATPVLAAAFFRRQAFHPALRRWVEISFLLLIPAEAHSLLLHEHYYGHVYNAAKFTLLLPAFWIGFVPALLLRKFRLSLAYRPLAAPVIRALSLGSQAVTVLLLAAGSMYHLSAERWRLESLLANPMNIPARFQARCHEVFLHASADDIVFSPDFATRDPLSLASGGGFRGELEEWGTGPCHRHAYLARKPEDIFSIYLRQQWALKLSETPFHLQLWTVGPPAKVWLPFLLPGPARRYGELEVHELAPSLVKGGASGNSGAVSEKPEHE